MYFWLTLRATSRGLLLVFKNRRGHRLCDPPWNICSLSSRPSTMTEPGPCEREVIANGGRGQGSHMSRNGFSTAVHRSFFARAHDNITTISKNKIWSHIIIFSVVFYFILFPPPPPKTSFSQLLLAFGCLSFNKHLLYSRNILRRPSDQSCQGLSCHFSHVCQNVTKMKYERQYQKTKPFDSWRDHHEYICGGEISPAESWSTYFFVRFNQFLHFLQRRDKLSSFCFMNTNVFQCSPLFFVFLFSLLSETVTFIPLLASCENRRIVFVSI